MSGESKSVLIVAGHAIRQNARWHGLEQDKFSDDMLRSIESHVEEGCGLIKSGQYDVLAFSGGRTRKDLPTTITNSEAKGMQEFAQEKGWPEGISAIIEPWARDSFENVFFSLLAFHKQFKVWPSAVGVLSMPHKAIRFMLMATGLNVGKFTFHGVGVVNPLDKNCIREMQNMAEVISLASGVIEYPLLRGSRFEEKRDGRTLSQFQDDYLLHVKQAYGNDNMIDQVTSCLPTKDALSQLAWSWSSKQP